MALVVSVPTGRTPSERVSADLGHVPDPVASSVPPEADAATPTTAPCTPVVGAPSTGDGSSPSEQAVQDPTGAVCAGQVSVLVVGDSVDAKAVAIELARAVTGRDGIDSGKLRLARQLEPLTAVLISINRRYKTHSGIRISGV